MRSFQLRLTRYFGPHACVTGVAYNAPFERFQLPGPGRHLLFAPVVTPDCARKLDCLGAVPVLRTRFFCSSAVGFVLYILSQYIPTSPRPLGWLILAYVQAWSGLKRGRRSGVRRIARRAQTAQTAADISDRA